MKTAELASFLTNLLPQAQITNALDEVTLRVAQSDYRQVAQQLRDHPDLQFTQMIDLCGVDCSEHALDPQNKARFAVVVHLLSVPLNHRLRLRTYATDDPSAGGLALIDSVTDIWPAANWFEREAFDLYGIVFSGHNDLRRLLTDYGFIGHPMRKDFPVSGHVEVRYDTSQKRVIYQPLTIPARELTPRIVREPGYGTNRLSK